MDDYMLQKAISGFQQCAALANPGLPEVFDYTIRSLAKITGLLSSSIPPDPSTNFPTVDIDGQTVTISPLALRFGTSFKSQLAAVVLFSIANDHAALVSNSWIDVRILLPHQHSPSESFIADLRDISNLIHLLTASFKFSEHGRVPCRSASDTFESKGTAGRSGGETTKRWRVTVDFVIIPPFTICTRT
jgi:hypothetical protein